MMDKQLYLRVERLEKKVDETYRRIDMILDLLENEITVRSEQVDKITDILEKMQEWMESAS